MDGLFQKQSYRPFQAVQFAQMSQSLVIVLFLQDQAELEVIQLKAIRIHVPATKLRTATAVGIVDDTENFRWPEVVEDSYPNRLLRRNCGFKP